MNLEELTLKSSLCFAGNKFQQREEDTALIRLDKLWLMSTLLSLTENALSCDNTPRSAKIWPKKTKSRHFSASALCFCTVENDSVITTKVKLMKKSTTRKCPTVHFFLQNLKGNDHARQSLWRQFFAQL